LSLVLAGFAQEAPVTPHGVEVHVKHCPCCHFQHKHWNAVKRHAKRAHVTEVPLTWFIVDDGMRTLAERVEAMALAAIGAQR
jgi:hypothetical protein